MNRVMSEGGSLIEQYKISLDDIEMLAAPIGEGSFGTVHRGNLKRRGVDGVEVTVVVAVKTLRPTKTNTANVLAFRSEIRLMAPLHHENLVNMMGASWDDPDRLALILEYATPGAARRSPLARWGAHAQPPPRSLIAGTLRTAPWRNFSTKMQTPEAARRGAARATSSPWASRAASCICTTSFTSR